ncbi:hypothetical protein Tco_1294357 [Tanacetum coccineum]
MLIEDIGVDEVSSAIGCVFHIGKSNEVRSKFGEFSKNKESVIEVVMGGGEAFGVYCEKIRGATEGEGKVLCYVQGSGRLKKKKLEAAIQRRLWDPGIKSVFQDNTLGARILLSMLSHRVKENCLGKEVRGNCSKLMQDVSSGFATERGRVIGIGKED